VLALAAAAGLAAAARAQAPRPLTLAGRAVLIHGTDTTALAGRRVVAHRVGGPNEGPIDSAASDARGAFAFRVARPDTQAMYVVSTLFAGIGYFSSAFSPASRAGADSIVLAVYDTSSAGAPLDVAVRHLVISAAGEDGSRDVLDIVQVANPGTTTMVARGGAPTFRMLLPPGIEAFRVGEGDVPPEAVRRSGDTMAVRAPFPPGLKQVVAMYVVPNGIRTLTVPIDQPTGRLEVLVEDTRANASGAALEGGDPLQLQGRTFRHFSSARVVRGETATITFGAPESHRNLAWLAIVFSALLLASGGWLAARRRGVAGGSAAGAASAAAGTGGGGAGPERDALLRQIVALDDRYASRQADTPPAEWAEYQARRAALKVQIAGLMAKR
jgi:hypothetical protein